MAEKPLALYNGQIDQLHSGDTIIGASASGVAVKDDGVSVVSNATTIIFLGDLDLTDQGSGQLDIEFVNGNATSFRNKVPDISGLKNIEVTATNSENYTFGSTSNKLSINIDKCGDKEITLPQSTITAQQVCDYINNALNSDNIYHDSYEYAVVDSGKVKLKSLRFVFQPDITINSITNDAYTVLGFSTGSNSGAEQKEIRVHPFEMLLPDGTVQSASSVATLDMTNDSDLENETLTSTSGQTVFTFSDMYLEVVSSTPHFKILVNDVEKTLDTDYTLNSSSQITFASGLTSGDSVKAVLEIVSGFWYYLYATDDSRFSTKKAFISEQRPNYFGEHVKSGLNGKYIGSFRSTATNTMRAFIRKGKKVYTEIFTVYNSTASSSDFDVACADYIPPTAREILAQAEGNSGTFPYVTSKFDTSNVGFNRSLNRDENYRTLCHIVDNDRDISFKRIGSDANVKLNVAGYYENVLKPVGV